MLLLLLSCFSHVRLFATLWTVPSEASLSVGFPRQEYWSGVPFLTPEDLPDPGIELASLALAGGFSTAVPPGKPSSCYRWSLFFCGKHAY